MDKDFEKLGAFYLGRPVNGDEGDLLLYNSKHLTTHAMIVGMTGSGKTGLALSMIEEAAIDGVPAILIDPKGDLGNILLQFPDLSPDDFRPWIDEAEAKRAGETVDEFAEKTAAQWRKGLAKWGQDGDRIRLLQKSADFAVYTPGDTTGRPLQILRSLHAPKDADETTMRDSVINTVSSLLGLMGIQADPVQSREHILMSAILYSAWRGGKGLSLEELIALVANPPFPKIGVFDVETFYPSKDRMKLAMQLNSLLASPGFSAWREGEPLDVASLLHTSSGKPRISVISIAHLSDSERMFFVTALLNETIAWMRRQTGTGSLRALLYMDEIFGYFPPSANPPSKAPMLTLLKQARAFGLGIVLSTQNPVDLDYKGLSNCGTWFIGRLQTDRDKQRVLDGLEGAAADSGTSFDRAGIDKLISGLGKRMFLMRDASDDRPVLFETRWAMSYMRGPLSMAEIKSLIKGGDGYAAPSAAVSPFDIGMPSGMPSPFDAPAAESGTQAATEDKPVKVAASVRLHFVDAKTATDIFETRYFLARLSSEGCPEWEDAEEIDAMPESARSISAMVGEKKIASWQKELAACVYRQCSLSFWRNADTKATSRRGEPEGDFRVRVAQLLRERRDAEIEKLEKDYAVKVQRAADKLKSAEDKVLREKAMAKQRKFSAAISWASTLFGVFASGGVAKVGNVTRGASAMRRQTMVSKKTQDVALAEESVETLAARLKELEAEAKARLEEVRRDIRPEDIELVQIVVRPRKTDISVERIMEA